MSSKKPDFKTPESREEYEKDAERYWKNIADNSPKNRSEQFSADQARVADQHLPSREQQYRMENYYAEGYNKTSRSGSFTSKPNASPAIFPMGRKAFDFIDNECTPGIHKPPEARPVPKEQTRSVDTPRSTVTIDVCMDCLKPVDLSKASEIICGLTIPLPVTFAQQPDYEKLEAMGLEPGDIVNYFLHMECHKAAEKLGLDATPLVLVKHGQLTDEDDVRVANKHGFALQLHSGTETTLGQWEMLKRTERMKEQLEDYLVKADKDSYMYRRNREKAEQQ